MKTLFYYIAGILFILLRGIALIFAGIYHLWQFLRYQVQCLRYPPPPGGMYGNMVRAYNNRPNRSE